MENKITDMVEHLSHSQLQIARILEAQRHAAVRMAQVVHSLPSYPVQGAQEKSGGGHVEQVNGSIAAYLNAMADLQQTIADSLEVALAEIRANDQGEE